MSGCSDPRTKPVESFLDALQKGDSDALATSLSGPAYTMFMNFVPSLECPLAKKEGPLDAEERKSACLREFYKEMDYSIVDVKEGKSSSEAVVSVEQRLHGSVEKKEYNVELIDGHWKLF